MLRFGFLIPAVCLLGCYSGPDWYTPPVQRQPLAAGDRVSLGMFVSMSHPMAAAHLVKDVAEGAPGDMWRWTYRRPELRFYLQNLSDLKLVVGFALAGETFRKTGPVAVSFFVNGRLFDKERYTEPGEKRYEKLVPADFLKPEINLVALEPDKVWIAPTDGAALGLILIEAGFQRQ